MFLDRIGLQEFVQPVSTSVFLVAICVRPRMIFKTLDPVL